MKNISTAVTGVCAGFFAVELVRYLWTSNKVLPYQAKPASQKDIEKAFRYQEKLFPEYDMIPLIQEDYPASVEEAETINNADESVEAP